MRCSLLLTHKSYSIGPGESQSLQRIPPLENRVTFKGEKRGAEFTPSIHRRGYCLYPLNSVSYGCIQEVNTLSLCLLGF